MGQSPHRISPKPFTESDSADLGMVLQTTLDLYVLLERFHQVLQIKVNYQSFDFKNQDLDLNLALGQVAPIELHFSLTHNDENLGEICFTKQSDFHIEEQRIIEEALTQLIFPLKNAISYQAVVMHSITCPLSQLGNRSLFDQTLDRELALAKRHGGNFALLLLDIDNFKSINDCHGHLAGDAIIRELGKIIAEQKRHSDHAFRYGGEEFAIILNQSSTLGAYQVAERIRAQIEHHEFMFQKAKLCITVSMGLTHYQPRDTINSIFERTDSALYNAKANGKNQISQNNNIN
jgi:diguanylate cyclase (GGDEF)-like protein